MSDPFAPPSSGSNSLAAQRARNNLYLGAAGAIFLSFFQFCCNPCFSMTIFAIAANLNAIRQPKWLEISLDEDYPADAGMVSKVAGYVGLVVTAGWFALIGVYILLMFVGAALDA